MTERCGVVPASPRAGEVVAAGLAGLAGSLLRDEGLALRFGAVGLYPAADRFRAGNGAVRAVWLGLTLPDAALAGARVLAAALGARPFVLGRAGVVGRDGRRLFMLCADAALVDRDDRVGGW
jgi:hypothetical protein